MSITDQIVSLQKKLRRLMEIRRRVEDKKRLARRRKKLMLEEREKREVLRLRSQGKTVRQIVEQCGITEYRVERLCRIFSDLSREELVPSMDRKISKDSSVNDLTLTVRCANCLNNHNILTVGQLCELTEQDLMKFHNLGRMSVYDLQIELEKHGLRLRGS